MIDYINMKLSIWGKWAVRRYSAGLGYPSVCPMFRLIRHGGGYRSDVPYGVDEYVMETDQAVRRLPAADVALCVEFYQRGGTGAEVARRLGIARQRLYERLDAVHRAVMGHLNDIAAGVD